MSPYNLRSAEFVGSFDNWKKCPQAKKPEFAFIGRSNVGKSSLINMLCRRKGLAKTSSTPGKTQTINLFEINEKWMIADLPGYGYAKVSKKSRAFWKSMIMDYVIEREQLICLFVLIDSRIPPQNKDIEFLEAMGKHQIPIAIVFTKTDKVKSGALASNITAFKKRMSESWETLPEFIATSANNSVGREELLQYISDYSS